MADHLEGPFKSADLPRSQETFSNPTVQNATSVAAITAHGKRELLPYLIIPMSMDLLSRQD